MSTKRETRLIIMEGMMGAGKSTTGQFVANHLVEQGIPAHFLPEWVMPHPIRVDDTLPHPYEPWRDVSAEEFLERSRTRWLDFVGQRCSETTVTVLDGQLFHGDLTVLMMMQATREQIDRQVAQITEITAPLHPTVIYLTSGEVPQALETVCTYWGADWRQQQIDWKTNSPYCKERGFSGFDGLVRLYQDYRALTDSLYENLTMNKMTLDTGSRDWARYQASIIEFLSSVLPA